MGGLGRPGEALRRPAGRAGPGSARPRRKPGSPRRAPGSDMRTCNLTPLLSSGPDKEQRSRQSRSRPPPHGLALGPGTPGRPAAPPRGSHGPGEGPPAAGRPPGSRVPPPTAGSALLLSGPLQLATALRAPQTPAQRRPAAERRGKQGPGCPGRARTAARCCAGGRPPEGRMPEGPPGRRRDLPPVPARLRPGSRGLSRGRGDSARPGPAWAAPGDRARSGPGGSGPGEVGATGARLTHAVFLLPLGGHPARHGAARAPRPGPPGQPPPLVGQETPRLGRHFPFLSSRDRMGRKKFAAEAASCGTGRAGRRGPDGNGRERGREAGRPRAALLPPGPRGNPARGPRARRPPGTGASALPPRAPARPPTCVAHGHPRRSSPAGASPFHSQGSLLDSASPPEDRAP